MAVCEAEEKQKDGRFVQCDSRYADDCLIAGSHEKWLEQKTIDGWKYGPVKNAETKEHPCFVVYEELPLEQRRKDYIFAAICKAFVESQAMEAVAA